MAESCTSTPGRQWSSTTSGTSELAQTTTSAVANRAAPRNVMRSGAPGPAPTKEITVPPARRIPPAQRDSLRERLPG